MDNDNDSTESYSRLNRALHSIAAHLHRYRSELNSLEASIAYVGHQLTEMRHIHNETDHANRRVIHGLEQTASQIKATNDFSLELEKKLNNILALVCSQPTYKTPSSNSVLIVVQSYANCEYAGNECCVTCYTNRHSNIPTFGRRDAKGQPFNENGE
jgi:hypothetical protein